MRKIAFLILFTMAIVFGKSQNIQLHYDFGANRSYLTTTLEKFSPDKYGSTFFFVDFNHDKTGPSEAYWEIARELKNWDAPFSVHLEYNGGLNRVVPFAINNAYLLGGTYSWNASDFSKGFSFSAMYKNIQGNIAPHNFQLTGVWYLNMLNNKLSFSGFADLWKEENGYLGTSYVFLTEPQLWFNATKAFALGGELELGYNFAGVAGFRACPTLGVKWTF